MTATNEQLECKLLYNNTRIDNATLIKIIDFDTLRSQLQNSLNDASQDIINPTLTKLLKDAVNSINTGLETAYKTNNDVDAVVFGRACLIDKLINCIYKHLFTTIDQEISIVAVGGYGRGELHPKSDIDLMILLKDEENQNTKDLLEKLLMLLWDINLEIGHSVRTVNECVEESIKDITVATNIMESRLLAGSENLFFSMKEETNVERIWDSKAFFQAKLDEQIQRNGKYNDTAYNLEPNIKESHGGLRDIQMIGWVAKRHFNADSLHDLLKEGFLLEDELKTLLSGQHLLWQIRCSLHYLAGRREDRLLFDYQRDLAIEFGFNDNKIDPKNEAIEQFMQQYYRTVIELERLNEMLLQHFREAIIYTDKVKEAERINDRFQIIHGYIETTHDDVFIKDPCAILEMFNILQEYPDIQGVRSNTIRQIREHKNLFDDTFRQTPRAQQLFIKIITGSRGVTHELRRMNRYGILAAYIPAFDSIVGRMQYDLFHAYTVDQHTLFVIRNMRRLSVPDYCHEFPLASGVFQHIKNPGLLYLSGLFHDIAKGRQGDHAILGAIDAKDFCRLHLLPEEDSELVSWLVRNHLIMSSTAQRKDINDPDVVWSFANLVKTLERLDYLYLLTISDIRGTNPKQWNDWKDKLLGELYNKTAALLNRGLNPSDLQIRNDKETNISEIQTASLRRLEEKGINTHQAHELWDTLNTDYFQSHTFGQIAWHTSSIIEAKSNFDTALIQTRTHKSSDSIHLLIYMRDREHIFYDVVSVLSNSDVSIVSSQIVNASNDFSLQSYRLTPVNKNSYEMELIANEVILRLQDRLDTTTKPTQPISKSSRKHKYFSSPTVINFETAANKKTTLLTIETIDRFSVLENIAKTFIDCDVKILNARIASAGEKALDSFTISSLDNQSLSNLQQNNLKQQLKERL